MAQVLAPIVQTSGPITMLHSSSDAFSNPSSTQPHSTRTSQMPRNQLYNPPNQGAGYRGTSTPIAPYAFASTPQLRQDARSVSAPLASTRLPHQTHTSSSSESASSTSGSSSRSAAAVPYAAISKDDTMTAVPDMKKLTLDGLPGSTINLSTAVPDLSLASLDPPAKPSPDRYRRAARRTDSSTSASSGTVTPTQSSFAPSLATTAGSVRTIPVTDSKSPTRPGHNRASSVDDMQPPRQGSVDQAKRYRRRSLSNLDAATDMATAMPSEFVPRAAASAQLAPQPLAAPVRPNSRPNSSSGHERQDSAGSASSAGSNRPSSSRQDPNTARAKAPSSPSRGTPEASKRVMTPSPLSKPITPSEPPSPAKPAVRQSPAIQQLSALNDKEGGRGMKSRLRRAFSFGSAAELRRATAENSLSAERARLRKDRFQNEEEDPEQAAIIAKQEAAGIGSGIYNGQGGFSGSNDNLSISSTASSASIMLRKMGSGMKKGGRSIKGLFRPKSVIGVPAADGPLVQPSVSMVTVEAERQKVNVNADFREHARGGTGYPRLERNSLDASRSTEVSRSASPVVAEMSRKSIVGGDMERAQVLSSIKKGILKRTGTASGTPSPVGRPAVPYGNETPNSSAPSTPNDDHHAHTAHVHISGDDYFGRPPRLTSNSTRSLPNTPQTLARSISFSPKLQFHDAWSSSDYDRRGEIATCNRLTPMLAQQIKEELNSFKMEMEVHELSKPHTHFF